MSYPLLNEEERSTLSAFVDRSPLGTAYLRRARILLLADDGRSQEAIASEVDVPIIRVRQMLRAFNRQRLALFPDELSSPQLFYPDDYITHAGRQIMGDLLAKLKLYLEDLETITSVVAIHESRKTIRRLYTAFSLFEPFYEAGLLTAYHKRFRKLMRRMGHSRDAAVFLIKLEQYINEAFEAGTLAASERDSLKPLQTYWESRKSVADENVRRYLDKGKYKILLAEFDRFVENSDDFLQPQTVPVIPTKVRHVAPLLIYRKVAAVRAYDDYLDDASAEFLHALRIQFKELRYTLEFFLPVMRFSAVNLVEIVKDLLTHLGDLNDALVHLKMLNKTENGELTPAISFYASIKEAERDRLVAGFPERWKVFNHPSWREQLAAAIAGL